jgi:hypothetical protein
MTALPGHICGVCLAALQRVPKAQHGGEPLREVFVDGDQRAERCLGVSTRRQPDGQRRRPDLTMQPVTRRAE